MKFLPRCESDNLDRWENENYTLFIPFFSVGCVAQLSADLLIFNLKLDKVGCIDSSSVIPVVGKNGLDENSSDLSTEIDLYENKSLKLLFLQFRSAIISGKRLHFLGELEKLCALFNLKNIILVSASDGDDELDGRKVGFLPFGWTDSVMRGLLSLDFYELNTTRCYNVLAKKFFEISKNACQSVLWLNCSVYQGENVQGALELAKCSVAALNQILSDLVTLDKHWALPYSWFHLQSKPLEQILYQ